MMKVLIAEDESLIAYQYRIILRAHNYIVSAICASGEEAIALTQKHMPDIILMDFHLKGSLTGLEAGKIIREQSGSLIPIIFITAFTELISAKEKESIDNTRFLDKPVSPASLLKVIHELKPVGSSVL